MTTVGTGSHTYTLTPDWAKMPPSHPLGPVSALASDSAHNIYVFHRADPPVAIFDHDSGNFISGWGNGAFVYAHGFYIEDDIVYLTDRDTSVCLMYTLDGKPIQMLGRHGVHSDTGCEVAGALVPRAAGPFNYPAELVPSPSGDLFVADGYRNARIHRFDNDGNLKFSWGKPGKQRPYEFPTCPTASWSRGMTGCMCATAKTAASRSLIRWATSSQCGRTPAAPPTSPKPRRATSSSASCRPWTTPTPRRSASLTATARSWRAGTGRSAHGIWCDAHGDIFLALTGDKAVDKYART